MQVKKALRGVKVEVTHRENVRRKYRISGLTSQPTRELMSAHLPCSCFCFFLIVLFWKLFHFFFPLNSFPVDEQKNMKSVVEYFQEVYGYTIQYSHLPCLQVGNQKKVNYLPMEVSSAQYFKPCACSNLFSLNQYI